MCISRKVRENDERMVSILCPEKVTHTKVINYRGAAFPGHGMVVEENEKLFEQKLI